MTEQLNSYESSGRKGTGIDCHPVTLCGFNTRLHNGQENGPMAQNAIGQPEKLAPTQMNR